MTGRGLALVQAMASSWGVDCTDAGGKIVWAVVDVADRAEQAAPLEVDLEALDAWPDDELPAPPKVVGARPVRLAGVPTGSTCVAAEGRRFNSGLRSGPDFQFAPASGQAPALPPHPARSSPFTGRRESAQPLGPLDMAHTYQRQHDSPARFKVNMIEVTGSTS